MTVTVLPGSLRGALTPPPSKSYAQRALAAALLCDGESVLHRIGSCDDTASALRCIEALGARTERSGPDTLVVRGGLRPREFVLRTGESGLATRLFTPIAALCDRPVRIEGEGSLRSRPMEPMIAPLRQLGACIADCGGRLPIEICGPLRGGEATIDGSVSSQFITGLLMASPSAPNDTTLLVRDAVSTPYIEMTIDTAARFGVEIRRRDYTEFYIPGRQRYRPADLTVEGDWSAAAMLLAAGAVAGEVTVENVSTLSKQADTAVCTALARSGATLIHDSRTTTAARRRLQAFEFDAAHCPDLFPALTALAAACEGRSVLHGASRLAHKECDRAEALRIEYGKLGIEIGRPDDDTMTIRGGGSIRSGRVDSHGDHRIAMSLAVAALRADGPVEIADAECVTKSYPGFFEELERIRIVSPDGPDGRSR